METVFFEDEEPEIDLNGAGEVDRSPAADSTAMVDDEFDEAAVRAMEESFADLSVLDSGAVADDDERDAVARSVARTLSAEVAATDEVFLKPQRAGELTCTLCFLIFPGVQAVDPAEPVCADCQ